MAEQTSNFDFLKPEWPELFEAASQAEGQVRAAPRLCLFSCRYALERAACWLYDHDTALKRPYKDSLGALIFEPTFREIMPPQLFPKVKLLRSLGNLAAHGPRQPTALEALQGIRELFHFLYWLYRSYTQTPPPQDVAFHAALLPPDAAELRDRTRQQLAALERELEARDKKLAEERAAFAAANAAARAELEELRRRLPEIKQRNAAIADIHDYTEAQTRTALIDVLLREAGWDVDAPNVREFPVTGMPTDGGTGRADYVLWGADGKPLAVIEAKRTMANAERGRQQAKLYADCLERMYGRRPVIFYTNGYETYVWDDASYPPRPVQGFHKREELERLLLRRAQGKPLEAVALNRDIAGRPYQEEGIRRVTEVFSRRQRKALVVMATGTGKTRFAIALADILQRAGWAKRILFLADRDALVRQARRAFLALLPDSNPVDVRAARAESRTARVVLSTYPTMMGVIDEMEEGERRFGVGHFDLIIIDEAHRSVYQKYRAIFRYFDSLLLGLTATPRDEVDRSTYGLFELERGVPTFHFELDEAVRGGWLVPPRTLSVPLKFQRQGIKYDELTEEEKREFEATFWGEGEGQITEIDKTQLNRWLFNQDTVDKVLHCLMEQGLKVHGGDRLGKTIVFAANHNHAEFIQRRFDANFPAHAGRFARVIDSHESCAQSLLDEFSQAEGAPHIAISVDMLDTGVDIPEVLNLVFFKRVYSKIKFHQMIGRGTRTCQDLFAPGQHKREFLVLDFCENLEFFNDHPEGFESTAGEPLHQRIFRKRLELMLSASRQKEGAESAFGEEMRRQLVQTVRGMNRDSFMIRPELRFVERYADPERWKSLTQEDQLDILTHLSGLQSDLDEGDVFCRRLDLLVLKAQSELLAGDTAFAGRKSALIGIAAKLASASKRTIPQVAKNLPFLEAMRSDEFWSAPTCGLLERVRLTLRDLVRFLDREDQKPVYTDFEDTQGDPVAVPMPSSATNFEDYRLKVRQYLLRHQDHVAINKLRMNKPLTPLDLQELERMLDEANEIGGRVGLRQAFGAEMSLGGLIRGLVGLDEKAAQEAFAEFLRDGRYNATQIHFVDQIIKHLTSQGTMDPKLLFEASPFTDSHSSGVTGVFSIEDARRIVDRLRQVNSNAVAPVELSRRAG